MMMNILDFNTFKGCSYVVSGKYLLRLQRVSDLLKLAVKWSELLAVHPFSELGLVLGIEGCSPEHKMVKKELWPVGLSLLLFARMNSGQVVLAHCLSCVVCTVELMMPSSPFPPCGWAHR